MEWNHENHKKHESGRFQKTFGFLSAHPAGDIVRQHSLLNFRGFRVFRGSK